MDIFRIRLNCIDHYQATPSKFDPILRRDTQSAQIRNGPKVPIIRIFGSTPTGQKVCAHIHGAFPYLYIEYDSSLHPDDCGLALKNTDYLDPSLLSIGNAYIRKLYESIDNALASAYRLDGKKYHLKYVAHIILVKGIPFYGFHVGYKFFMKISLFDPIAIPRLSDVLRQGLVMNRVFQPYEAHLQYTLQWMADYNLYGSSFLESRDVAFRAPIPSYSELGDQSHLWHNRSIPQDRIVDESTLRRSSYCSIEVDICVQHILNRQKIKPRYLHHNFTEYLNPSAPPERLVHSMAELWMDETRRRKDRMSDPNPGSSPFPPEVLMSMSADHRYSQAGGWIHEEDYKEKVKGLILREQTNSDGKKVTFDNFLRPKPFESSIKSVAEAIEDPFPKNLKLGSDSSSARNKNNVCDIKGMMEKENDGTVITGYNISIKSPYTSDQDVDQSSIISEGNIRKLGLECTETTSNDSLRELYSSEPEDHKLNLNDNHDKIISPIKPSQILAQVNFLDGKPKDFLIQSDLSENLSDHPCPDFRAPSNCKRKRSPSPFESRKGKFKLACKNVKENHKVDASLDIKKLSNTEINTTITEHNVRVIECNRKKKYLKHGKISSIQNNTGIPGKNKSQEKTLQFPVVKTPHQTRNGRDKTVVKSNPHSDLTEKKEKLSFRSPPSSLRVLSPNSSPNCGGLNFRISSALLSLLVQRIKRADFNPQNFQKLIIYHDLPPSKSSVISTMQSFSIASYTYQEAFYSNHLDVPDRTREWAGQEFRLKGLSVDFLPKFNPKSILNTAFNKLEVTHSHDQSKSDLSYCQLRRLCGLRSWSIADPPPTCKDVQDWLNVENTAKNMKKSQRINTEKKFVTPRKKQKLPQIEGPTQKNQYGFKYSQDQNTSNLKKEALFMSLMSLEIHVNTRGDLLPDPEQDEVKCLFWCLQADDGCNVSDKYPSNLRLGIIVLSEDGVLARKIQMQFPVEVHAEASELDLMLRLVEIVRNNDPDILTAYEVQSSSWGYLIERARVKYDYNLTEEFSRIKIQSSSMPNTDNDKWGHQNTSTIRVVGRYVINIWRIMRCELNLLQYTIENVVFHLLHRRIPHYKWADLTKWLMGDNPRSLALTINYHLSRVQLNLEILERNEFIERTSEQARLLGVDFFSVISRGSQYKVESLMFRIAKPESFLLISPSKKQVGSQNALECLPLVMEPQSAYYTSPVLVLDFQSLYPSVIIAYNYCYSTFLGRIDNWRGISKMGFTEYRRQQQLLELLQDHINISPNGIMYAKPTIRKSLLAKMLGEILETRVMVKSGMKIDKDDKALRRLLNNRQLALKLIANVTYGYTSASFSGRMPCSEIADSIVQTGRETLEKTIAFIHSVKRWGAEVVYGDTDSIFVNLKGRTKDQAFDIGEEIAKTVTNMNPRPMKLKFEKVYLPCILIAKKRYVGFKYESRNQLEPEFDAKGIETVRRDGTPAEQKIEEKALKILFRTSDLSQVKSYFQDQCEKIMKGTVSIQDFCFSKEVKMGTYSHKGLPPPGALISTKRTMEDARAVPQYGERVPYVVISGAPGARLADRCVRPEELLENSNNELDSEYYITKNIIPPLQRIFGLIGVNLLSWYDEMPKFQRIRRIEHIDSQSNELAATKTIESYMKSLSCLVCSEKLETEGSICEHCLTDTSKSLYVLQQRLNAAETGSKNLQRVCQSCSEISPLEEVRCRSQDCPVFYTRMRQSAYLRSERSLTGTLVKELAGQISEIKILDW